MIVIILPYHSTLNVGVDPSFRGVRLFAFLFLDSIGVKDLIKLVKEKVNYCIFINTISYLFIYFVFFLSIISESNVLHSDSFASLVNGIKNHDAPM